MCVYPVLLVMNMRATASFQLLQIQLRRILTDKPLYGHLFPFLLGKYPGTELLGCIISIGEGKGNPLHYSCLGNPMDRGA